MTTPDRDACLALLEREGVPEHIRDHSVAVADIAVRLAGALNRVDGEELDPVRVEAGALLHDIRKFYTIQNGGNHGELGGEAMRELGYPHLAPMVERHVELGPWDPQGPVTEEELINYADKRVRHTQTVGLMERFDDLVARYAATEAARRRIESHREVARALEEKIFRHLPFGPEAV